MTNTTTKTVTHLRVGNTVAKWSFTWTVQRIDRNSNFSSYGTDGYQIFIQGSAGTSTVSTHSVGCYPNNTWEVVDQNSTTQNQRN